MMNRNEKLTWLMATANDSLIALRKGVEVEEKAKPWPHIFMTGSAVGSEITLTISLGVDSQLANEVEKWAIDKRCKSVINAQCTVMIKF